LEADQDKPVRLIFLAAPEMCEHDEKMLGATPAFMGCGIQEQRPISL
jgi:hypothetical protein